MAIVALDEQGKPNFNLLQNSRSAESHIMFYAFDVLVRKGEELVKAPLSKRREILASTVSHMTTSRGPSSKSCR
jgi:ATP-dependent DNA ligase